ncbi:unnamed protein product [Kluyveromyces dobzhanskii CBS 2104]|uniref:WGS project CCBQ000000000 data, contig 00102 n=1 Tax=Kluyveromyces dobzhanskii CBS 2104 TaxID=1427455 RepID=A0A0A8L3R3_9SACH|nr:unnamed protein product [Kluyveromyces dobzhanskii CBS 2104]
MERQQDEGMNPPKGGLSTTIKPLDVVVAQYDFNPTKKSQLRLSAGDIIYVISKSDSGWWDGTLCQSKSLIVRGWFPRSYTKSMKDIGSGRKMFTLNHHGGNAFNNRPSSHGSRRSSLIPNSPSVNMKIRSASASRRGSLVTSANYRRKSFSSTTFQDSHENASNNGQIFSCSPSNSMGSTHTGSPSSHLKQDYQFDMNRRSVSHSRRRNAAPKSRSASSSSSRNSYERSSDSLHKERSNSESRDSNQSCGKQSISSSRSPRALYESEANILSAKEVEMLLNNMSTQEFVPVWTPVLTTSNNLLYFNRELNVYCTSLPISRTPELGLKSVFPPNENLVDLAPKNLDHDFPINTPAVDGESSNSSQHRYPITSSPANTTVDTSGNPAQKQPGMVSGVKQDSSESYTSMGQSPKLPAQSIRQNDTVEDKQSQADLKDIPEPNSLSFYSLSSDMKTWTELKNSTLYYLKASHSFFFKQNQSFFYQNFSNASTHIFYHQLACKLSRKELAKKNVVKDVRKILKKLVKVVFRINVNASFYFNSNSKFIVSSSDIKGLSADMGSFDSQYFGDANRTSEVFVIPNNIEMPDLRNVSTSTTTSFNQNTSSFDGSQSDNMTSETMHINQGSPRTSVPTNTTHTSDMLIDEETGIVLNSLFNVIQTDFTNVFKLINNLHNIIVNSISPDDSLVQIYPRFIRNSFEGTIWTRSDSTSNSDEAGTGGLSENSELGNPNFSFIPESLSSSIFSGRQYSNSSTRTTNSILEKQNSSGSIGKWHGKSKARSKEAKTARYPLNHSTLNLIREKLSLITSIYKADKTAFFNSVDSGKLVELSMGTYNGLKVSAAFLNIIDKLDLQFFFNLKQCHSNPSLEKEFHEFSESSMTNAVSILLQYYDLKQALHDITIRYVMDTQNLSLRDPFVFCSMRGELSQFSKVSDGKLYQLIKSEKKSNTLYEHLISQDVEVNGMSFVQTQEVLHDAATSYYNIASLMFLVIEQLIVERENVINYAARMMNNDFMEVLLKNEQYEYDDNLSSSAAISQAISDEQDTQQSIKAASFFPNTFESKSPNILQHSFMDELPWYLDSENEADLVYSPNGYIKGGTRIALIEHLTDHKSIDAFFNIVILTAFRSIFSTSEFLRYLFKRFELSPPEGLSYEEYNIWVDKKQKQIRMRVINIIKTWLTDYWNDCYYEDSLDSLEELNNVANMAILDEIPGSNELKPLVEEKLATNEFRIKHKKNEIKQSPTPPLSLKSPSSKTSTNFRLRKQKLTDFDAVTFAQQLTLEEHILYSAIDQFECLDRIWHKKICNFGGSANISNFITSSNHLTDFVSYNIVKETDTKKRAQILQFFIQVSEECYNLKNFSSMTAIVSALYSSPIYRLKKTFDRLPKNILNSLDKLNTLMDSTKNFFRYRELLKTVQNVPCVPFFGVYLSDLTFTASGNPDNINNNPNLINFSKRLKIVMILTEIMSFQKLTYKLKHSEEVKVFLETEMENIPSIEKQYELSLKIEPRVEVSSSFNSAEYNSSSGLSKAGNKKLRFGRLRKQP